MKTAAVIVAAGMSSRMGAFKPLQKIGDKEMIRHVIDTFRAAGIDQLIVVTGRNASRIKEQIKEEDIVFLENKRYEQTQMFDSAKIGFAYALGKADRVFFTPADIPLFSKETVSRLLVENATAVKPSFHGRGGHPLLLDSSLLPFIIAYSEDGGMKGCLLKQQIEPVRIEVPDEGILLDADTKEELEQVRAYYKKNSGSEKVPKSS